MKCRFLVAVRPQNPAWSQAAADAAADRGEEYVVPQRLEFGPGYTIEDPQAWIHCCPGDGNSPAIAEPVDDECREAVRKWMEVYRPAGIAQLKAQFEQIDLLKNPEDRRRLMDLARAYGLLPSNKPKSEVAATT